MSAAGIVETVHRTSQSDRPLRVFDLTGERDGPTLALIGAIHGDEMEGPVVLSHLLARLDPARLSGRLIVCPVANAGAVAESRRCSPVDGANLARCFPGDTNGSPTAVLAELIARNVIAPADAVVDLHSGGTALTCPIFAGYADTPGGLGAKARDLAEAFGAPVIWRHEPPTPPGRTMSFAEAQGIPGIYAEAGGGPFPPADVLDTYRDGVLRVMAALGMIPNAPAAPEPQVRLVGNGDLDNAIAAPATGLCTRRVEPLDRVDPGSVCFEIHDVDGTLLEVVKVAVPGIAVFVRRSRWVEAGELLMATATEDS